MTWFTAGTCNRSTPHIYVSALPFCGKSSWVYRNYWGRTRGLIEAKGSAIEEWSASIGVWDVGSKVNSVAFSPDGTHIVSGSNDHTI